MAIQNPEIPFAPDGVWSDQVTQALIDGSGAIAFPEQYLVTELPQHISDYKIRHIERKSLKEPEVTKTGAHIYQEICTFFDSNNQAIVREATIAVPNKVLVNTVPNVVAGSDPWVTGPRGLNRIKTRELVDMGFPVVWLHHADQRSPLQRNKCISRSASQGHALLDDLGSTANFNTKEVVVDGYSRGGMTGEKFIALEKYHGRKTIFSILDAPCFAVDMKQTEKVATIIEQLPKEIKGIGSLAIAHFMHGIKHGNLSALPEFAQTLNLHPKNIAHEIMWARALVNANVGSIIAHQPLGTKGIRNFFEADTMSQIAQYVELYEAHKGIRVVRHPGAHVAGAGPEYIYEKRRSQFSELARAILQEEILDAETIIQRSGTDTSRLSLVT
jgi:hypothetical protein